MTLLEQIFDRESTYQIPKKSYETITAFRKLHSWLLNFRGNNCKRYAEVSDRTHFASFH